jgi:hypothetical protein
MAISNKITPPWPTPILLCLLLTLCLPATPGLADAQTTKGAQAPNSSSAYRIAGTVLSKTDGHPLARARVIVRDAKNEQKFQFVITSEDGKFEFAGLPAGKYSLTGAKRGFISAAYDQHDQFSTAIVTGAALDTENLVLKLAPAAVLTGKVLDEAGEPVRHANVTLYYDDHQQGVDRIHSYRNAQTDDLGTYEITPLMPGTYFLSASARPWYAIHPASQPNPSEPTGPAGPAATSDRSLDVAYPTTYYPDETDTGSAAPIPVRGGEHVQADIHMNPVPALRLIVHVPGDDKSGFAPPWIEQPAFDGSTFAQFDGGRMVSPGVFELDGIPAGRYNLRFPGTGSGLQMNDVDLTKDAEEIDTSAAEPLSTIKVSVETPGATKLPPQLTVGLRSGTRAATTVQKLDAKGEAEFQQLPAGHYEVLAFASDKRYSISHMATPGAEVAGHTLTVAPGATLSLSLTLVEGSAEIQGTAKLAGKGFAGAMVVLVPKNPELNRDLFRRDQSDLDGTFRLFGVVPGSYTLLAIDNGWDLDWSRPEVMATYVRRGHVIEVSTRPLRLSDPIEVQSK